MRHPLLHPFGLLYLLLFVSTCLGLQAHQDQDDFPHSLQERQTVTVPESTWWYAQIPHQGSVAYGFNSTYKIWRNVKDYGAKGEHILAF